MPPKSFAKDQKTLLILFGILVKRLGGKVNITQADIDDIAYNYLDEALCGDGSLEFQLVVRKPTD